MTPAIGLRVRDLTTGKLGTVTRLASPLHAGRPFPVVTISMDSGLVWSIPGWAFEGLYGDATSNVVALDDYRKRPAAVMNFPQGGAA